MYPNPEFHQRDGISAKHVNPLEIPKFLRQLSEPTLLSTFQNMRRKIGYLAVTVTGGTWIEEADHEEYVGHYDYQNNATSPKGYRFSVTHAGQVIYSQSVTSEKSFRSKWEHLGHAALEIEPKGKFHRLTFYTIYDKRLSVLPGEGEDLPPLPV